jgi:hypothetical protein
MPIGFGPQVRAQRLLRQGAGLMPGPSVPVSTRRPEIQALLNLQLGAGMITESQFQTALSAPPAARPSASVQAPVATQGAAPLGAPLTGRARIRARQREWREQFLPRGMTRGRFETTSRLQQQQELRGTPGTTRAGAEARRRVGQRETLRGMTRAQAQAEARVGFF